MGPFKHFTPLSIWKLLLTSCAFVVACTQDQGADDSTDPAGGTGASSSGGSLSGGGGASGGADAGGGATPSGGAPGSGGAVSGGASSSAGGLGGSAAGAGGGGGCEPFIVPEDCEIPENAVLPGDLRCTGLYETTGEQRLRCDIKEYTPAYQLYSDNEEKHRYVWLPPGSQINLSDPDEFIFPVGTKFWKEFWVGPANQQVIGETRLLQKSDLGWIYTAYVWNEEGTAATQQNDGVEDLFGTGHTVPSREQCKSCHVGRQDFILGWDAFLLGTGQGGAEQAGGITLADLDSSDWLAPSEGKDRALTLTIPGNSTERAALSYLHVNCGVSCHNQNTNATGKPSGLFLRLEDEELSDVHATDALTSGMNRAASPNAELTDLPAQPDGYYDIRPLDPSRSLVAARMNYRGSASAMPPLGTHDVDEAGLELITTWINQMTEEQGYPAADP